MKELKFYVRNVYGQERIYLVDSPEARSILLLTKTNTLNILQLTAIESLGFTLKQVIDETKG